MTSSVSRPILHAACGLLLALAYAAPSDAQSTSATPKTAAPMAASDFIDRCVNAMGSSPEYAWAMKHPEIKPVGDPLSYARSGLIQVFAWPTSPGFKHQRLMPGPSIGPVVPISPTPEQESDDVFQTEAVILANTYHQFREQAIQGGASETAATAAAVDEVKSDARIWCGHVTQSQYWQQ